MIDFTNLPHRQKAYAGANGNWGFLYDEITDTQTIAPVFDCGSSLYPQADEDTII